MIWERFPKFVLGFVAASLVFSFALAPEIVARTRAPSARSARCGSRSPSCRLASETHLGDLLTLERGRPLVSFVLAQAFNVLWTLLLAWLVFGGVIWDRPVL